MTWVEILMLAIGAALTSLGFAGGKAPKRRECGALSALAPHSAISRSHRQIHSVGNEDAERVSYRLIHMNGAAAGPRWWRLGLRRSSHSSASVVVVVSAEVPLCHFSRSARAVGGPPQSPNFIFAVYQRLHAG